jgi:hypothetical protein
VFHCSSSQIGSITELIDLGARRPETPGIIGPARNGALYLAWLDKQKSRSIIAAANQWAILTSCPF